jgi:hypothetical protein
MAALDEPDRYTFTRDGKESGRPAAPSVLASWMNVMKGPLRMRYLEHTGIAAANKAVEAYAARRAGGLKPGFTRAGKPADPIGE